MEPTHYQILEIDQTAVQSEIRKKYLEMAFLYHPDKNYHLSRDQYLKSEHKFQLITRAFQVLSDPDQRAKYDHHLKYCEKKAPPEVFYAYKSGSYSFNVSPVILEVANKLFSNQRMQNLKDFLNVFGQFTSSSDLNHNDASLPEIIRNYKSFYQKKEQERKVAEDEHRTQLVRKPKLNPKPKNIIQPSQSKVVNRNNLENPFLKTSEDDLVYTANVSLTDIYLNAQKVLNVPRKRVCDHCLGVGYLGYGSDTKIFSIDIKKTKLLFEKEGNQRLEHLPGDLIIYVQPKPHPTFRIINQYDLLYIHQISLINLYQYLEIQLEHLDGRIYNIIYDPKDNNVLKDKCLLKIKEKGLLMGDSNRRGDLYIQLKVQYPDLTREQFIAVKQILLNNVDVDVDDLNNFNNFNKNEIKNNDKVNIELMAELPDQSYQVDT
jgi:DnaJ-class molecular chaperone